MPRLKWRGSLTSAFRNHSSSSRLNFRVRAVYYDGTLVAQGEVVVVDEQFGIRLTHVFSPNKEILEGLGD